MKFNNNKISLLQIYEDIQQILKLRIAVKFVNFGMPRGKASNLFTKKKLEIFI